MFIYGLEPREATAKALQILQHIEKSAFINQRELNPIHLLVSPHSITVIGVRPVRHMQIVLRCYR